MLRGNITGPVRAVRGFALGLCVLSISVAGHAGAGQGSLPDLVSFLLILPLAVALSVSVAGRRRGVAWLLAYLLAVQALFHVVLALTSTHPGHHLALTPTASMLMLHLLATFACAVALTFGDRHLVSWLRFLDCLARDYFLVVPEARWAPVPVAGEDQTPRIRRVVAYPWQHRGPPVLPN